MSSSLHKSSDEVQVWSLHGQTDVFSDSSGHRVQLPSGWEFVASGDAGLTRRLKSLGAYWSVVHRRRGRLESVGVCVPSERVCRVRADLAQERGSESYRRSLARSRARRAEVQVRYASEFFQAVVSYLSFAPRWHEFGVRLARAVSDHAVPVGSGTVARTSTLPLAVRAEAAVIAWMRHQTTCYDEMSIAHVRGARRDVRRHLAERSRELLGRYRRGEEIEVSSCPLWCGLETWEATHARASSAGERGGAAATADTSAPPASPASPASPARSRVRMNGHLGDFFLE